MSPPPAQANQEDQPINPQQELFCQEYIKDRNGTQAAIRAKYSAKSAKQQASELLTKLNIAGRVNQLIQEQFEGLKIEAKTILKSIQRIAESDPADAYHADGTLKNMSDIPEALRKSIASVEKEELYKGTGKERKWIGYTTKIRFWNKNEALRDLGRHKKLFIDVVDNPALNNLALEMKKARERRKACRRH